MTARRMFSIAMVLAATVAAACSDATGPEARDMNGSWAGSITHPGYDGGSLSMVLIDANGAVEGTYTRRLTKRVGNRAQVVTSGGRVTGSSSNGRLTLRLEQARGDDWLLEGRLGNAHANGDWSIPRGIRGTFDISR